MWLHLSGEKETIFPRRQHWTSSVIPACWCISGFFFGKGSQYPVWWTSVDSFTYLYLRSVSYSFTCVSVSANLPPRSCSCSCCCEARLHGEAAHRILAIVVRRTRKGGSMGVQHAFTARYNEYFSALARKRSSFTTTVEGSGPSVSVTDV